MILLTGITGTCGKEVLKVLCRQNIPVRAMVRDKVKDLSMPGLSLVQGDLENESAIEKALQGVGREINYADMPAEEFSSQLRNWGSTDWYVDAVTDLFGLLAQDSAATVTDSYQQICARAPRSFRQFIRRHASVFTAS